MLHLADLAKGIPCVVNRNTAMSDYRKNLDWSMQIKNSIYPPKALKYRNESEIGNDEVCTMCGDFCAIKKLNEII
jgi:phosphomethylpyrimidine synthase